MQNFLNLYDIFVFYFLQLGVKIQESEVGEAILCLSSRLEAFDARTLLILTIFDSKFMSKQQRTSKSRIKLQQSSFFCVLVTSQVPFRRTT